MAVTSSSGRRTVRRLPTTNSPTGRSRRPAADDSSTAASSAIRFGSPSAAGEALHRLPTIVPRCWICTPPMASAAVLQPVERRRQGVSHEVGPGRQRRDADDAVGDRDRPQARQRGDVEDLVVDGASDPGGVDVGAAGEHRQRSLGEGGRAPHRGWSVAGSSPWIEVRRGRRRQDVAREALEHRRVPVERVEDHVVDAAERIDLALGCARRAPRPRRAGSTPASSRGPSRRTPGSGRAASSGDSPGARTWTKFE